MVTGYYISFNNNPIRKFFRSRDAANEFGETKLNNVEGIGRLVTIAHPDCLTFEQLEKKFFDDMYIFQKLVNEQI
jgi:hypothetical protein